MSFGIDSTGFTLKTLADVLSSIRTKQQALFGAAFAAQLDTSVVGQLNGVFANEIADLWLLAQSVYRSRFPSQATGVTLDYIAAETGVTRLPQTKSTVTLTITGSNGTVVPVGFVVSVATTGARFATTASGTIAAGTLALAASSEDYGPILAPAGTLTNIVTPIGGVSAVTNALDAAVGTNLETDAALRLRRSAELRSQGEATIAAIRADLLAVSGVSEVFIFNNTTEVTDGNGLPPHSFEPVVRGGVNQALFDQILQSQPAGIASFGTTSGTSVDATGTVQTVQFTRPTDVNMYVEAIYTRDSTYGGGSTPVGDAAVKQAIVDYWLSFDQRLGRDVVTNAFYGIIYSQPGVVQVTSLKVDSVTPCTSAAVTVISQTQVAVFDTSRITVS